MAFFDPTSFILMTGCDSRHILALDKFGDFWCGEHEITHNGPAGPCNATITWTGVTIVKPE